LGKGGLRHVLRGGGEKRASLDQDDLCITGVPHPVHEQVKLLAALAQSAHLDGVVCSPYEIAMLREHGLQYQYILGRCGYSWGSIRHLMLPSTT